MQKENHFEKLHTKLVQKFKFPVSKDFLINQFKSIGIHGFDSIPKSKEAQIWKQLGEVHLSDCVDEQYMDWDLQKILEDPEQTRLTKMVTVQVVKVTDVSQPNPQLQCKLLEEHFCPKQNPFY